MTMKICQCFFTFVGLVFISTVFTGPTMVYGETLDVEQLEIIEVTARKRRENLQQVPLAVSSLRGVKLASYSSAGKDIRFLNAKVPSLSVESSFGRTFPRFYIRGLGNTDFDLNASQPVSLVVDDVVQENPILKSFPIFDVEQVEVLRGPQGSLFGRNTPAGVVKITTVKPSKTYDAFAKVSYGSHHNIDFTGAIGTGLSEHTAIRFSALHQRQADYINVSNQALVQVDQLGGYHDSAGRLQLLYEKEAATVLFNLHMRELDGTPMLFRANIVQQGTQDFSDSFDAESVFHDAATNNEQSVTTYGANALLEYRLADVIVSSVSAYESAKVFSRADIDGGYGAFGTGTMGPDFIPFAAETADGIPDHHQFTQEFRLAGQVTEQVNYQLGLFYFTEDLTIDSFSYDTLNASQLNGYAQQQQDTQAWALFGTLGYIFTEQYSMTAGLRYSEDEKQLVAERFLTPSMLPANDYYHAEIATSDSHVSWDLSFHYAISQDINTYGRIANSFRAPSIQGRLLFSEQVTVADAETIHSFELGLKADVLEGRGRINQTIFYFTMDDQQLTAVGGNANVNQLINADKTRGYGYELDSEFVIGENFLVTANISYNYTQLLDPSLSVAVCAQCTVINKQQIAGLAQINGNSLPHAPRWIVNFTSQYARELALGEFFIYTDWSYRSELDFFLYKAIEFEGDSLFEAGVRLGYRWSSGPHDYELAIFGRNITNEQVLIGGVDFNNNTGMINDGRFWGAEFNISFY